MRLDAALVKRGLAQTRSEASRMIDAGNVTVAGVFALKSSRLVSPDEAIETGIWECSPGTFIVHRDGYDEIAQILSGSATITGEDGTVVELKVDSTIVTPEGWRGTWVVHEPIRKMFVIRRFKK